MLNRLFVVVATAGLVSAAEPRWRTPGACITPAGTLCRTLVYESSGWANRGWGFHAIEWFHERSTTAVRSDGATVLRIAHQGFKYWLIGSEHYDRSRIVLPAQQRTIEIEHSRKEFREMGGVWSFVEFWTDEPDCSQRAANAGETARKTGEQPIVAGIPAIEYIYGADDRREVQRIAFAPSLGCTAVAFSMSQRNASGLPVSEHKLRLVTSSIAEPDASFFTIPTDYQLVQPEETWPHISMPTLPGDVTTTGFSLPLE